MYKMNVTDEINEEFHIKQHCNRRGFPWETFLHPYIPRTRHGVLGGGVAGGIINCSLDM